MAETQESDSHSYLKLSQLYAALEEYLDDRYIKQILNRPGDINYQIPNEKTHLPNFSGCTALFFAFRRRRIRTFNLLLNRGADFTIKNDDGSTVLHEIIKDKHKKYIDNWELKGKVEDFFIGSLLSCHVQFKIHDNPCNRHGVSHFHAACMTNNTRAVKYFLNNGVSVDQTIDSTSPVFPGYTPLHFASRFCALETAEILLENGANVHVKDSRGMTALHLLLERDIRIMYLRIRKNGAVHSNNLLADVAINEKIINLLLENDATPDDWQTLGLTKFHVACAMTDSQLAKRFLKHVSDIDQPISVNSPVAPGCSALHLAAMFNFDMLKLLLIRGANIKSVDVNGKTPVDICLEQCDVYHIHDIISYRDDWTNILLSDGKTNLLDLLYAMRSPYDFSYFLQTFGDINAKVPGDSPWWPNHTALHLAITLYNRSNHPCNKRTYFCVINDCLSSGADVTDESVDGHSVVHLAFKLKETKIVDLLFQRREFTVNLVDEDGWSYLHIACLMMYESAVEKLLHNNADVSSPVTRSFEIENCFIAAGSTALHIAVTVGCPIIVNLLVNQAADLYATDVDGLTPIHRSLMMSSNETKMGWELMTTPNLKECLVDGFSHLHVACFFNCISAVKKLLHLGANVNGVIGKSVTSIFFGLSPLHIAIIKRHWKLAKLLVKHGAEVNNAILLDTFKANYGLHQDSLISIINRCNVILKDFTLLHIACKKIDVNLAKKALSIGVNVNKKTADGDTALHLLMIEANANDVMYNHRRQIEIDAILKLLLDGGADVSITNDSMQTPLLIADKSFYIYMDKPSDSPCRSRANLMLKSIRDFSVNPVNIDGLSHFHVACSWNNVDVVEAFLNSGVVDVNQTTDYFANQHAGYTALHLILISQTKRLTGVSAQLKTIEILLKHGIDVTAKDAHGNTPLHMAAMYSRSRKILFDMIVRAGADINAKNIYGETPLEILLKSEDVTIEEIGFFLNHGCRVNEFNPIDRKGYISMTFSKRNHETMQKLIFEAMINSPTIDELDDTGCTAIHNVVSTSSPIIGDDDYVELIERLIKLGCDIDHQNELGKTALHIAVQFQNDRAVYGLLSAGADINISDVTGKSAFLYSLEPCKVFDEYCGGRNEIIKRIFSVHVQKLQINKLDVSRLNEVAQMMVMKNRMNDPNIHERLFKEITRMKDIKIGSHSFLHDFMSETGAVTAYPNMSLKEREAIDDFFESGRANLNDTFYELADILRLQYRKALARFALIETAKASLNMLTGIPLPDPCSEDIFVFLKNSELKNLIESSI